ncbi:MAG: HYExAFE family protein [Phycisphaerales bacterium]|nr:HYExAFE family protein [Phycisphaerales bacterium]
MARQSVHYERAFEAYLRARRIPYVAVSEARKALLPEPISHAPHNPVSPGKAVDAPASLKSFDFVLYGPGQNYLVDVKGRRDAGGRGRPNVPSRLESWVTREDVHSLGRWEGLFGSGFVAAFVFMYWADAQPADAHFVDVFEHDGAWYIPRLVTVRDYVPAMRTRSDRWKTVHVPGPAFRTLCRPLYNLFGPTPEREAPPRSLALRN